LWTIHTPLPSHSLTSQGDFVVEPQPVPSHPTRCRLIARTLICAGAFAAEIPQKRLEAGQTG
jgi:hypothetical protein